MNAATIALTNIRIAYGSFQQASLVQSMYGNQINHFMMRQKICLKNIMFQRSICHEVICIIVLLVLDKFMTNLKRYNF